MKHGRRAAEIGVIANQGKGGEAGRDDRRNDKSTGVCLEGAAHLLDAKDDAGERGVEGGCDARCGSGQDQARLPARRPTADREHD